METSTIDKLYLELSQFSNATTKTEMDLTLKLDKYKLALTIISNECANPAEVARNALAINLSN